MNDDLTPLLVDLRRELHRHPELGLNLPKTQAAVLDRLAGLGLDITTGASTTSITADLRNGPGPTILLRGDMDALPMPEDTGLDFASEVEGAMHACGHDAHTSMLVGAAHHLAARRDEFSGTIRFMFQPGEEGFAGATFMIDEGVLEGVDAAFALHITPNAPAGWIATRGGALMASADTFKIVVRGRGGHASMPYLALDPVPVAAEMVTAFQTMITRSINAFDPAVLTVAKITAGTTTNVIPEIAVIEGTFRTVSEATRSEVMAGIQRVADGVAAAHDAVAEVAIDVGYPVTINHAGFVRLVSEVVPLALPDGAYIETPNPVMGAEDFSYVLQQVPGAMAFLGVCPPDTNFNEASACHSNKMLLHEPAMNSGVAVLAEVAIAYLADPTRIT
ncbi:MAG: M20 metallopeptidase family protein [Acidimicrobiales bacterium]|jgi:hippurate hydrolase